MMIHSSWILLIPSQGVGQPLDQLVVLKLLVCTKHSNQTWLESHFFMGKKMENHLQIMADIRSPEGKKLFVFYLIRGWIFQPRHPFRGDDTVDGPAKSCTTKRIVETIKKKIPPNNW